MTTLLNMGGIQKIEIALAENITLGNHDQNNQVVVSITGSWDEIDFTQETASFSENEKAVKEGIVYESKLNWQLPKISPTQHIVAHKYTNKEIIIKITDANGTELLIGTPDVPAYVYSKKQIPSTSAGFNGYSFNVKHQNPRPAYFVA